MTVARQRGRTWREYPAFGAHAEVSTKTTGVNLGSFNRGNGKGYGHAKEKA
jgi:hypothetical protein